jgi:hypothetical protein
MQLGRSAKPFFSYFNDLPDSCADRKVVCPLYKGTGRRRGAAPTRKRRKTLDPNDFGPRGMWPRLGQVNRMEKRNEIAAMPSNPENNEIRKKSPR